MSFGFDPTDGLVIVEAEVWGPTGSIVLRMALDTGAITTLINASPLQWVGYDPAVSSDRVQITTASGIESSPVMCVQRIGALDQQHVNHRVVCHTLPPST